MNKFTPEEVSLCKQVAEKYKKPLKDGCLVLGTHLSGEEFVGHFYEELTKGKLMKARLDEVMVGFCETAKSTKELIPLWTISDCLEFFNERAMYLEGLEQIDECEYMCSLCEMDDMGMVRGTAIRSSEGKTPLEACLKAVLAMLEEAK